MFQSRHIITHSLGAWSWHGAAVWMLAVQKLLHKQLFDLCNSLAVTHLLCLTGFRWTSSSSSLEVALPSPGLQPCCALCCIDKTDNALPADPLLQEGWPQNQTGNGEPVAWKTWGTVTGAHPLVTLQLVEQSTPAKDVKCN